MAKKKSSKNKEADWRMDAILVLGLIFVVFAGVYIFTHPGKFASNREPEVSKTLNAENMVVRKPAVAGSFYPADKEQLSAMISEFLGEAEDVRLPNVKGLIAPHAGYVYSGPTAAWSFKQLVGRDIQTVVIIAPSHHVKLSGASVLDVTHFETPLGLIPVSAKVQDLLSEDGFANIPAAHSQEHSIEVELPFLQFVLGDFELVPIVVGRADPKALAGVLSKYLDDSTLVVASTDLSHYKPYADAVETDKKFIETVPALDVDGASNCEACGIIPVLTLMHLAQDAGWVGRLLDYTNSGDTAGDKNQVVGYASVAFYDGLNESEEEYLLALARETLEKHYNGGTKPQVDEAGLTPRLKAKSGCFVTLNKHGSLRGCIGHILPQVPLYECVMENALNAALHDGRFQPVTQDELGELHIDISMLTTPKKMEFGTSDELLRKLVPGRDGVVLNYLGRTSTYLPQVWGQIPGKEQFLSSLCQKQGSRADCWKVGAEVEVYGAQVFAEKE